MSVSASNCTPTAQAPRRGPDVWLARPLEELRPARDVELVQGACRLRVTWVLRAERDGARYEGEP